MESGCSILSARVNHARRKPVRHSFTYGVDYLLLDEASLEGGSTPSLFGYDRPGLVTLRAKDHGLLAHRQQPVASSDHSHSGADDALSDHGFRVGSGVQGVRALLRGIGIEGVEEIALLAHPRYWGYTFNPVSFWLMFAGDGSLRAVLSEVHNTFGDRHGYLCVGDSGGSISGERWYRARKQFHVSPFFDIDGEYRFRFVVNQRQVAIRILYDDGQGGGLATSLVGVRRPFTDRELARALLRRPLGALRVSALIHWQAIKLFAKGVRYRPRPAPREPDLTC